MVKWLSIISLRVKSESGNRVCFFEAMGDVLKRNVMRWFGHVDKRETTGIWKPLQR